MDMTALALTLIRSQPFRFLRDTIEDRVMLGAAGACALFSVIMGLVFMRATFAACAEGESVLVYPHYSRKGIVTRYEQQCGIPHASCVMRSGGEEGKMYDCSPFAIPRNTAANTQR